MNTGATGTQGNQGTQGTSDATEPAGVMPLLLAMFPNGETGPTESPFIATIDELLASREATIVQENTDRATLAPLLTPSRDQFRPQLFQWVTAGFPSGYVVQMMQLNPPNLCSDGVARDLPAYTWYLLGTEISSLLANINSMMTGIAVSFSFAGNSLLLHVTKL